MKHTMLGVGALLVFAFPAASQWSDNFDSYANNTLLNNVGGWAGWDNASAAAGTATNAYFRSAPNSILIGPAADAVRPKLGATSGRWVLTAYQYIPTGQLTNHTWVIVNNRYNHGGPYSWSCQFRANATTKMVEDRQAGGRRTTPLPVVFDQWVQWRLEIDIDDNTIAAFYNGQLLSEGTYVTSTTAPRAIENLDLFSQGATCYYDDISLSANAWSDDFDTYNANTLLDNVGGWAGWDNASAAAGTASTTFFRSAPNSIEIGAAADAVRPKLGRTSGRWVLRMWQYIPTGKLTNHTWIIVNNRYNHGGPYSWSCQFRANATTKMVEDRQAGGRRANALPVVFDQWMEWRLEIDIDLNTIATYYGGQLVSEGTYVTSTTAPKAIENIDLFSQGATCYYDDISLHEATDSYGLSYAQTTAGSADLTLWVDEPAAANSISALTVAMQNAGTPYQLSPLVSGWVWMDNASLVVLGFVKTDANGRGALKATVPNVGLSFQAWSQAFSAAGSQLLASDPIGTGKGDDGTSGATVVYNPHSGRYTVNYVGTGTAVLTLQPAGTKLGEFGKGGFTGQKFLAAGDSLVVTDKATTKELTRTTRK